jgi:hypothetical protein
MSGNGNWDFLFNNSNVVMRWFYPGYVDTGLTALKLFAWHHIAFSISGGRLSFYVNGTRVYTNASVSITNGSSALTYLGWNGGNSVFPGYLSGARITKGSTPYDPTSTVIALPLTPPTAITNTQLLCNFTNGAIFDEAAKCVVETVGDAQLSTSIVKYGGSSIRFDGSGDYLQVQSYVAPPNFNMGTGDYTVEFWMYGGPPGSQQCLIDFRSSDTSGQGFALNYRTDRTISLYMQGDRITTSALTASTWTHVAAVRVGGVYSLYVNGISAGTWSNADVVVPPANRPIIGAVSGGSQEFLGYMDDIRVTKGVARYITNFTPPTSAMQNQ